MRDDAYGVRLAHRRDLHHLRDAADIGQRGAHVVDVVVLHEPVEVPALAPLLAVRQRAGGHLAQLGDVLERVLVAHRVFYQEGLVLLDQLAAAQRVGEVEPLVEVDGEVAVLPRPSRAALQASATRRTRSRVL